jgi:site-specific recombinase XerD
MRTSGPSGAPLGRTNTPLRAPPAAARSPADGHIPRSWFREHIWKPALQEAGIGIAVRTHDLRHADASWLLAGGADLQTVKERLGHGSIITTEKYLHTLAETDDTALATIRARHGPN